MLAFATVPTALRTLTGVSAWAAATVAVCFLAASLLSLSVIWIEWKPTMRTLARRTAAYRLAVLATGGGLVAAGLFALSGAITSAG